MLTQSLGLMAGTYGKPFHHCIVKYYSIPGYNLVELYANM